jgi:hypothetical protein
MTQRRERNRLSKGVSIVLGLTMEPLHIQCAILSLKTALQTNDSKKSKIKFLVISIAHRLWNHYIDIVPYYHLSKIKVLVMASL